jgi:hypothetical protein
MKTNWNILRSFGIFYGYLEIWWQFGTFGSLCQEKSGNLVPKRNIKQQFYFLNNNMSVVLPFYGSFVPD